MDRLSFLKEQLESVTRALSETLRHDYGPERSASYYGECRSRLQAIRDAIDDDPDMDRSEVAGHLEALTALGQRVALIERSHLGEFSWPFAYAIEAIAEGLFREKVAHRRGKFSPPIVHVIAEGVGYQILDDVVSPFKLRRILVVAFPRQLRHHVLLHSIFGHELGHPAQKVAITGRIFDKSVLPSLKRGALRGPVELGEWLTRPGAPPAVHAFLAKELDWQITEKALDDWRREIACDLFGLILFGPAFAIAHRTVLDPSSGPSREGDLSSTHPPYPLRRSLVARAMRELEWDTPVLDPDSDGPFHAAESAMLSFASEHPSTEWDTIITDEILRKVLAGLGKVFAPHSGVTFTRPTRAHLIEMLRRLSLCRPPIVQTVDLDGHPDNKSIPIQHCLYAGWSYWYGREGLLAEALKVRDDLPELSFLLVNRLCEQAMLQQRAIDLALERAA